MYHLITQDTVEYPQDYWATVQHLLNLCSVTSQKHKQKLVITHSPPIFKQTWHRFSKVLHSSEILAILTRQRHTVATNSSQRSSVGWRSGDCGDHLNTVNSRIIPFFICGLCSCIELPQPLEDPQTASSTSIYSGSLKMTCLYL